MERVSSPLDYHRQVEVIVVAARRAWELLLLRDQGASQDTAFTISDVQPDLVASDFMQILAEKQLSTPSSELIDLTSVWLNPYKVAQLMLSEYSFYQPHDLKYFIMREIRKHYDCVLSHKKLSILKLLVGTLQEMANASFSVSEIIENLKSVLTEKKYDNAEIHVQMFIEICRVLDYLYLDLDTVKFKTASFDVEHLIGQIFGLPTGMQGFDELFGGNGILLLDNNQPLISNTSPIPSDRLLGRTLLVRGRYGSGKTLLSLKIGAEVARKGGIVLFLALEQTAEECLYALESIGVSTTNDPAFEIVTRLNGIREKVAECLKQKKGVLIVLRTIKNSYENFAISLSRERDYLKQSPLRLIIADPVNSIEHLKESIDKGTIRSTAMEMFKQVKQAGTNILLVEEESPERSHIPNRIDFEQNISDTVVRLGVDKRHGYAQRYLEITKSRFQREHRGEHPFAIKSGVGFQISPSSAAVRSRVRNLVLTEAIRDIPFGFAELDAKLGRCDAIRTGDTIVMHGDRGVYKTQLGLLFLYALGTSQNTRRVSLYVSARKSKKVMEQLLDSPYLSQYKTGKEIICCSLAHGFVDPGFILQRIEEEIERAERQNKTIDRVLIDDIAQWDMSCPFVRADETFADTLVDVFKSRNITSLLLSRSILPLDRNNPVQRAIISNANVEIAFSRIGNVGKQRVLAHIFKTPRMLHKREPFEITFDSNGLHIPVQSSLLRIDNSGIVSSIPVNIYMHSESNRQRDYNESIKRYLKSTWSQNSNVKPMLPSTVDTKITTGFTITADELSIILLDEFQLPERHTEKISLHLHEFAECEKGLWGGFIPAFKDRITATQNNKEYRAIPLYANYSFMAYNKFKLSEANKKFKWVTDKNLENLLTSWKALADACFEWEKEVTNEGLFFDCPQVTLENYNCLFIEILLALNDKVGKLVRFSDYLKHGEAKTIEASLIYRRLCHRSHMKSLEQARTRTTNKEQSTNITTDSNDDTSHIDQSTINVDTNAIVWRHWYSTLHQMLDHCDVSLEREIEVIPLPEDITVSGEWYIGIPSSSSAAEVGVEIICYLTSPSAELERRDRGVGMPTREAFYSGEGQVMLSSYSSLPAEKLGKVIENAFRRSGCPDYMRFSNLLGRTLQRIIEIPESTDKDAISLSVKEIWKEFERNFETLNIPVELL